MKAQLRTVSFAILFMLVLAGVGALWAAENLAPGSLQTRQESNKERAGLSQYGQDLLKSLVGDVPIPKATVQSFSVLFERHRQELERLANAHQDLVWETLEVVIEFLPSLKTMDANGGQVRVNRKTYAKASGLLEKCERLASPELAQDLRTAKVLVDSRLKEGDQESLIINLND